MQIAEINTPSTILAYVAYTPSGVEKGTIDVEADIQQAWQRFPIQTDIALALIQEITVTDFNHAIQRHEMYDTQVRDACTKQFFRILQNMIMAIKSQTVWPMRPM